MNRAILISIRPEWTAKILNGDKTILICKTAPKCDLPIDVYIYCTKGKIGAWFVHKMKRCFFGKFVKPMLNGKVVAKFRLESIYVIHNFTNGLEATEATNRHVTVYDEKELLAASCLTEEQIRDYGAEFAWHISDLQIFDDPKELREFQHRKKYSSCGKCPYGRRPIVEDIDACKNGCEELLPLAKAPKSWCYVEEKEW